MEDGSVNSYSMRLCSSSSQAMRVALSVLGFSMSEGAPAIIWRARLAANTTYANWLCGAFVCTVISVFPSKRCQKFFHANSAASGGAANRHHNSLGFAAGAFHILIDDAIVVITPKRRNFVPRLGQTPANLFAGILPAAAEPPLQFCTGRRQNENGHRLGELLLYLRGALHVNLEDEVETFPAGFFEPFFRRAVRVIAEDARIFQKLTAGDHGIEFRFRDKIIAFPGGFGRAARPGGT